MGFDPGEFRHVVDFERRVEEQDEESGGITLTWKRIFADIRVAIIPRAAREFVAASAEHSEVKADIVARFRPGLNATQRIVHGRKCCTSYLEVEIFNPAGFLRDRDTGLEYVTIPCTEGVNDGE